MTAESIKVRWSVDGPTQGLSQHHIWRMAVRHRRNQDLTRFLDALEANGACDVVVSDAAGRETHFPCKLPCLQLTGADA